MRLRSWVLIAAALIALGVVVLAFVGGEDRATGPSLPAPPSSGGWAYDRSLPAEMEAKLAAAPDDAARLDILAQAACVNDALQIQRLQTVRIIAGDDPLLLMTAALNARYTAIQGNGSPGGRVPTAASSLSEQQDKFCAGFHPVG